MGLLDIRNLRLVIDDRVLCQDLTISVANNERVGVTGPSGCGKTTLLRSVIRKRLPPGSTAERFARIDSVVGYVPQDGGFCPWFDLERNFDVIRPADEDVHEWRRRAAAVTEHLDLQNVVHQFPGRLSGGEKQRSRLARVMVSMPEFLIVDEPLTEVPLEQRWRVLEQWSAEMATRRAGLLLVSHDIDVLLYLCDHIVVLGGTPATVQSRAVVADAHPRVARAFLTSPSTNRLRDQLIAKTSVATPVALS